MMFLMFLNAAAGTEAVSVNIDVYPKRNGSGNYHAFVANKEYNCLIGRGGLCTLQEKTAENECAYKKTPCGTFSMLPIYYRGDRIRIDSAFARAMTPELVWVTNPAHAFFHSLVSYRDIHPQRPEQEDPTLKRSSVVLYKTTQIREKPSNTAHCVKMRDTAGGYSVSVESGTFDIIVPVKCYSNSAAQFLIHVINEVPLPGCNEQDIFDTDGGIAFKKEDLLEIVLQLGPTSKITVHAKPVSED